MAPLRKITQPGGSVRALEIEERRARMDPALYGEVQKEMILDKPLSERLPWDDTTSDTPSCGILIEDDCTP